MMVGVPTRPGINLRGATDQLGVSDYYYSLFAGSTQNEETRGTLSTTT